MKKALRSQYIRANKQSTLLKRWVACILLQAPLEDYLIFERIEKRILFLFDTKELTKENQEDAEFIRAWLKREYANCDKISFDENDVFSINTKNIAKLIGLSRVELSILRFSILFNNCKALESAADISGDGLSETDVCDLLRPVLGESSEALYQALNPQGRLYQTGLLRSGSRWGTNRSLASWLQVPELMLRQVFREQDDRGTLEKIFYSLAPRSSLTKRDFNYLEPNLTLVKNYLSASYKTGETGVNILIWGPPGTGKTEVARYLGQSLRKQTIEINTMDGDRSSLNTPARFDCYRLCQAIAGRSKRALVIYDEVEDVLSDGNFANLGFKAGTLYMTKGLINNVLETNPSPTIWITNTLKGVDPAYLRRFDIVLRMKMPVASVKKRIARSAFKELPVSKDVVNHIAQHEAITPAHLQKASKICIRLGVEGDKDTNDVLQQVLNADLDAIDEEPLHRKKPDKAKPPQLNYRPELINSDMQIQKLSELLDADSSARICLYGPPGTGKTAWGHYLATAVKQPLLIKHAADILDAYIGNTEKNIVAAFEEASSSKSILLLDEVDSFLQNRSNAHRHWEVAHVNQFLTAMEQYTGIFICTTNLMDNLDPATLRRFDFKVRLDYMTPDQAQKMALNLFSKLGVKLKKTDKVLLYSAIRNIELSHGDFAALFRRYSVLKSTPSVDTLISDLHLEISFREKISNRPIGFIAGGLVKTHRAVT
ncbi:AAA family ATPase [Pseudomonadota bacterium]